MSKTKHFVVITTLFLVAYILRTSIINIDSVASGSMLPLFDVDNRVLSNQLAYGLNIPFQHQLSLQWSAPKRGDVVLFRNPHDQHNTWMKRVIGLPHDKISFQDHRLYINGTLCNIKDRYHEQAPQKNGSFTKPFRIWASYLEKDWGPVIVPEGQLFLMGDNRGVSIDSRTWGMLPQKYLMGKVVAQTWPIKEAHWLDK